jgi:hypothetical protein
MAADQSANIALRELPQPEHDPIIISYIYERLPLGPCQIRVLDFPVPDSSTTSSNLSFIPRVINLDDHPSFTALSYVWVPPDVLESGQAVETTHNCRLALKTLSQTLGGLTGIWVDAICIN